MSRRWKIAIAVLVLLPILAFAIGAAVIYRMLGWNYASRFVIGTVIGTRARPLTSRQFERTPARVERGRYLVEAARCFNCHSETDSQTDLPIPGAMGAGTVRQLLTTTTYPNITPDLETGAGSWASVGNGCRLRQVRESDHSGVHWTSVFSVRQGLDSQQRKNWLPKSRSIRPHHYFI
jgi:hypothetical protein